MKRTKKIIKFSLILISLPLLVYVWEAMFVLQIAVIWPFKILPLYFFTAMIVFILYKNKHFRKRLTYASIIGSMAFISALGFELIKVNPHFAPQKIESESFKNIPPIKLEKTFMNRLALAQIEISKSFLFSSLRNDSVLYVMRSYLDMQYVLSFAPLLTQEKISETCQAFNQYENLSYCLPRLSEEIGQQKELTATGKVLLMTTISTGIFNLQRNYEELLKDQDLKKTILTMRFVNDLARLTKQIMMEAAIPLNNQNLLTQWVEEEIKHKYVSIALKKMNAICEATLGKAQNTSFEKSVIAAAEVKELRIHQNDFTELSERFHTAYEQTKTEDKLYQLFAIYKDDFFMRLALWFRSELVIE